MTLLGYIALPIGLGCFFFAPHWLFRLLVFWSLFSATSAMNLGSQDTGSGLQMWMFFGVLWLARSGIDRLSTLALTIDRRIFAPCLYLTLFVFVACTSILMPLYIDGRLLVTAPILGDNSEAPLYLTAHNFTQLLYLIFGAIIAVSVAHLSLTSEVRKGIERTLLISAIFFALWGGVEFICNTTGIPYPSYIFNNSISPYALGFLQVMEAGGGRISSAAVEPSVFAQGLVAILPLTIPAWLGKGSILSPALDRAASLLFILMLILSASSTAIIGIFTLAFLCVLVFRKIGLLSLGRAVAWAMFSLLTLAIAVGALLIVSGAGRALLDAVLLNKASSASALERIMTITLAFGYFKQFPLLGIGWGSVTSHDMFAYLLANVGIIGASIFTFGMLMVISRNWKGLDSEASPMSVASMSWFLSLAVFLLTSAAIGFPLVFGNFWITLGVAIGTGGVSKGPDVISRQVEMRSL